VGQNVVPTAPQYEQANPNGAAPVTVTITIATDSAPAAEYRRGPHYFSRSSRGLLVQAFAHGSAKVIAKTAVDISPGSAACGGKKTTPRTCSATLMLAPSAGDDFSLFDYAVTPQSGGFPKRAGLVAFGKVFNKKISTSAKKNKFDVYLGGVIKSLKSKHPLIPFPGDGESHTAALMIEAADWGNNPITAGKKDPYANPITVSVTETGGRGHTKVSLNGAAGATSVVMKYSTDTVEIHYDGRGTIGYGARLKLKTPIVNRNSGGAQALFAIQPLVLGSASGDYTPGHLGLRGNGEFQTIQIGEANAYQFSKYSLTSENCNAVESAMPVVQSSQYNASFALITRSVAATPSASGCLLHVSDGMGTTLDVQVGNTYSGSVGVPVIATTPIPNPTGTAGPTEITVGPDGALWFTECDAATIARIAPGVLGTSPIQQHTLPTSLKTPGPTGLYSGPDGNLWYTDDNNQTAAVGKMTTAGTVLTTYPGPSATPGSDAIAVGSDGNMWFTNWSDYPIAKITTSGTLAGTYVADSTYQPNIALGPDGNLWFTQDSASKIGRISTDGSIKYFTIPTANSGPWGIVAGPDGAMWFTECNGGAGGGAIGRIPVNAVDGSAIQEFSTGMTGRQPVDITVGPDGALWFTYWNTAAKVGRITTAATPSVTTITEYAIPGAASGYNGWGITSAPDGALYFVDRIDNVVGRIAIGSTPAVGHANWIHRTGVPRASEPRPSRRHGHRN
jgi:virginiamycin B lyase